VPDIVAARLVGHRTDHRDESPASRQRAVTGKRRDGIYGLAINSNEIYSYYTDARDTYESDVIAKKRPCNISARICTNGKYVQFIKIREIIAAFKLY